MKVNCYVLVRRSNDNIGCFKKIIEFPCMPPMGTEIFINKSTQSLSFEVKKITYSESTGQFSLHFDLDIEKKEIELEQPLNNSYIPITLIKLGFELEWLEDKHESILTTLQKS